MGRELKRVPLDFAWPQGQVWEGYLNPFYKHAADCEQCGGSGSSPTAVQLKDKWYGYAPFKPEDRDSVPFQADHPIILKLAERNIQHSTLYRGMGKAATAVEARRLADHFNRGWQHHLNAGDIAALLAKHRLMDLTHTWAPGSGWKAKEPAYTPTPQEVNAWSLQGLGHDSINQWIVANAECERLGVSPECAHCVGAGQHWNPPEAEQQAEDWKRAEPPAGDGYQLWETTTEGSPISPVFAKPEQLAEWLAESRAGTIDEGTTAEQWLKFILGPGWAPTVIGSSTGVQTGVQAA